MVKQLEDLPERYKAFYPYKERPRQDGVFGVTEILYCLRKSFLTRVVPAPTAVDFEVRRRFARGHASEAAFFGEKHNPLYVAGEGELKGLEGHTDHVVMDKDGKPQEIVEYKSTLRLWYKSPNGKSYYTKSYARKSTPKEDWDNIVRTYNDNHMDQLMLYMYMAGIPKGYLIYTEMSTDANYIWEVDAADITDEFKKRMADRLNILRNAMLDFKTPPRSSLYGWECALCTHNKHGVCDLCDAPGFDLKAMCDKLKKDPSKYSDVVGKEIANLGVAVEGDAVPEEDAENGDKVNGDSKEG